MCQKFDGEHSVTPTTSATRRAMLLGGDRLVAVKTGSRCDDLPADAIVLNSLNDRVRDRLSMGRSGNLRCEFPREVHALFQQPPRRSDQLVLSKNPNRRFGESAIHTPRPS